MSAETYEFTDEMGEISGFGGSYERACRDMVIAGVEWLDEHPDAEPEILEMENVIGLVKADNDAAEQLTDVMADAAEDTPTGAMMHACVRHVIYVGENGWDEYVELMESPPPDED